MDKKVLGYLNLPFNATLLQKDLKVSNLTSSLYANTSTMANKEQNLLEYLPINCFIYYTLEFQLYFIPSSPQMSETSNLVLVNVWQWTIRNNAIKSLDNMGIWSEDSCKGQLPHKVTQPQGFSLNNEQIFLMLDLFRDPSTFFWILKFSELWGQDWYCYMPQGFYEIEWNSPCDKYKHRIIKNGSQLQLTRKCRQKKNSVNARYMFLCPLSCRGVIKG